MRAPAREDLAGARCLWGEAQMLRAGRRDRGVFWIGQQSYRRITATFFAPTGISLAARPCLYPFGVASLQIRQSVGAPALLSTPPHLPIDAGRLPLRPARFTATTPFGIAKA